MKPPPGFRAQEFPLRHKFYHAAGLNPVSTIVNTAFFPIVRNYLSANAPTTIDVNPKHVSFDKETGAICNPHSIIDKLKIKLDFNFTEDAHSPQTPLKLWWQPVFNAFPEKLDAADDFTGTTVATILQLVKDVTEEDVTPIYANTKHSVAGASDRSHPSSTVNFTETFGTLNMDTNLTSEGVTWDDDLLQNALLHYTNKGALRSCLGRRRYLTLDQNHKHKSYFIDKQPPRAVRRIVPYSFFGIIIHVPLIGTSDDQAYFSQAEAASIAYVGVRMKVRYNEWNQDHRQEMSG